jgi:hypothetical protein
MKFNWHKVRQMAHSDDRFDRINALGMSMLMIEIALTANGIPTRLVGEKNTYSNIARIKLAHERKLISYEQKELLIDANTYRNKGVHNATPPNPHECEKKVGVLKDVWSKLRSHFVSSERAAKLARDLMKHEREGDRVVRDVYLFGSLARLDWGDDIDLLLLDRGELSTGFCCYGPSTNDSVEWILEQLDQATIENRAAARCGWIDIIVFDREHFGSSEYMRSLAKAHVDKLFLLNIAEGILLFDRTREAWTKLHDVDEQNIIDRTLMKLSQLRDELRLMGLVSYQD